MQTVSFGHILHDIADLFAVVVCLFAVCICMYLLVFVGIVIIPVFIITCVY